jgi:hypothetical protein
MKQSRRMSLIEAIANVVVGFCVALLTQIVVFPLFGLKVSLGDNLAIGGLFCLLWHRSPVLTPCVGSSKRSRGAGAIAAGHEPRRHRTF